MTIRKSKKLLARSQKVILSSDNHIFYKIIWNNCPPSDFTWMPISHLRHCIWLVDEYENKMKVRKARQAEEVRIAEHDKTVHGSFQDGDKIRVVLAAVMGKNGDLKFRVRWFARKSGSIPLNSVLSNECLKENDPQKLVQFYEDKLIWAD